MTAAWGSAVLLAGAVAMVAVPAAPRVPRSPQRTTGTFGASGRRPRRPRATPVADPSHLTSAQIASLAVRVAALSRAGLPTARVWAVLAQRNDATAPLASVVARTIALGGSPAEGFTTAGVTHGPLTWVAMAHSASQAAGAPLAEVLDAVASAVRAEQDAEHQRDAALAGPMATAAVLTWLPVAGIGLGLLGGTDGLTTLITSAAGRTCLVAGMALWAGGRWWMRKLLAQAAAAGDRSTGTGTGDSRALAP